jgi:hypothetical protein
VPTGLRAHPSPGPPPLRRRRAPKENTFIYSGGIRSGGGSACYTGVSMVNQVIKRIEERPAKKAGHNYDHNKMKILHA